MAEQKPDTCKPCRWRRKTACIANPPVPMFIPNPITGKPTLIGVYPLVDEATEACRFFEPAMKLV